MVNVNGNPNMKKGAKSVNPAGRPAAGQQAFKDRLAHWLETKNTEEIQALVRNRKEWGKLLAIDAIVVRRIHSAMQRDGSNADFTAILDRLVGRPVQPIAAEFKHTHGLADRLKRAMAIVDGVEDQSETTLLIEQSTEQPAS